MNRYGKNYENIPYDEGYDMNTFSTYDCTGLIPSAITDFREVEAYEDLYPYLPADEEVGDYFDDYNNLIYNSLYSQYNCSYKKYKYYNCCNI